MIRMFISLMVLLGLSSCMTVENEYNSDSVSFHKVALRDAFGLMYRGDASDPDLIYVFLNSINENLTFSGSNNLDLLERIIFDSESLNLFRSEKYFIVTDSSKDKGVGYSGFGIDELKTQHIVVNFQGASSSEISKYISSFFYDLIISVKVLDDKDICFSYSPGASVWNYLEALRLSGYDINVQKASGGSAE